MTALRLLPVWLSAWLLAAHYVRGGEPVLAAACALAPAVLLVRRPWVVWTVQAFLTLAVLEWLRAASLLVMYRQHAGLPYARLAAILLSVAALTAASALVFRSPVLKARYGRVS